jgi:ABC-type transport system involved in multi-copper enzyme maturation permease subunit
MGWQAIHPAGPIFTKELRLASRRHRSYWMRIVFVFLLTALLISIWHNFIGMQTSGLKALSRMAMAGQAVTISVIWFEFVVFQIVVGVILSSCISDEIHCRSLGVLMTTPVTSVQIVVGKLLSHLCQIGLLLGITLPVLAMIRVFGGVPWHYLVVSLTLVFCRCLFVGSLSLLFSIYTRRAYVAILATGLTVVLMDGIIPGISWLYCNDPVSRALFMTFLGYCNSCVVLMQCTQAQLQTLNILRNIPTTWFKHCFLLLSVSGFLILWASLRVRQVGLRLVTGGPVLFLLGTGLFFSTCFRHTTAAVIANLLLAVTIWILLPFILSMFFHPSRNSLDLMELTLRFNPMLQTLVILEGTAKGWGPLEYFHWEMIGRSAWHRTLTVLAISSSLYAAAGGVFMSVSHCILRRRIY